MSFIRRLLFPKPVINNGSQLRDHLANERTFLSWTRMGLAFAAMALALGRLGMIDRVFNNQTITKPDEDAAERKISSGTPKPQNDSDSHEARPTIGATNDILASQLLWSASIGSLGYGIFRYVSVRRTLIRGQFVPGIWGPVLMTCCSLGSLAPLLNSSGWRMNHERSKLV